MAATHEAPSEPRPTARRRLLVLAPLLVPLGILYATGLWGLDFGRHWDEGRAFLEPLRQSIAGGRLLPGKYNYPSFGYALTLTGTLPDVFGAWFDGTPVRERLLQSVATPEFLLRLRHLFLAVTCLSVAWVYLLVHSWRRCVGEAFLAASLLGLSWEVAYHARWVAPDAIVMQFGALTLFLCVSAMRSARPGRWLVAATVAAGLGCGTKYPGGLLLVPVLLATYFTLSGEPRRLVRALITTGLVFAATYLITTPGTLLDTQAFQRDLAFELKHYRTDGHGVYSVAPGVEHAGSMLAYLSTQLFSPHYAFSVFLSLFVLVGAVVLWREDRRYALLLIVFPVLYLAYMSSMRALIVRNLLVLAPFLAVLAARGACWALEALPGAQWPKRAGLAFAALLVAVNGAHLVRAAGTITGDDPERFLRAFSEHVTSEPDERFFLSPRLRASLAGLDPLPRLTNVVEHAEQPSDHIGLYMEECADSTSWKTLNSGIDVFGTLEVNFRHYPTWSGETRILLMTLETARAQGIPMFRDE